MLKEHDAPLPSPPVDSFAVLRAVAGTTRAIVRAIRRRPRSQSRRWAVFPCLSLGAGGGGGDDDDDGEGHAQVKCGEENDAIIVSSKPLAGPRAEYDPVRQPSAVLHPQDAVLVPATKMAAFVLECLVEDFGVGARVPGRPVPGPCGQYVPWVAQLPADEQQFALNPSVPRMKMVESEAQMATRSR
ncbi:hypothetical protein EVG20_g11145 [Dentipellis fragilis]|uniref:Uncharacterized protein n=1 Tax=Dentipellis fragilis TaxID=205917 RepID=A0A4Y9XLH7_9AGAM|nr:hypothetical protein EVG20_g11145 [Dentipellis fragilis]